jgi:hypothetical protein
MADSELDFSCFLQKQPYVYKFALKILYYSILSYSKVKTKKELSKIIEIEYDLNDKNIILKQGFSSDESLKIINLICSVNYNEYILKIGKKYDFHQIMGAFYGLLYFSIHKDYVEYRITKSLKLQNFFMTQLKKTFNLPSSIEWNTVKEWLKDNERLYSHIFELCINCPESIVRRGMNNFPYIRNKVNGRVLYRPQTNNDCHSSLVKNGTYITKSSSFYQIDKNMFYHKILSYYKRPIQAGPSESAISSFLLVFLFVDLEKTKKNMLKLLLCIIADYVPHFHSLTEILMVYSFEIGLKYKIDKDPVKTVKEWMNKYL